MTVGIWKFSQVISLSFVAILLAGAFIAIVGADGGLMSDVVIAPSTSAQGVS